MKPATIIAIVIILVILILPVFFLDLEGAENQGKSHIQQDVPANAPHPHKLPPEMQREIERMRAENRFGNPPPDPGPTPPQPPSNEPPPLN